MSNWHTIVPLIEDVLSDMGFRAQLQKYGAKIPESLPPFRWPTVQEISEALNDLSSCKSWGWDTGWEELWADGQDCDVSIKAKSFAPENSNEQIELGTFNGYCNDIIEPLFDHLFSIGILLIVVRMNDGEIIYAPH